MAARLRRPDCAARRRRWLVGCCPKVQATERRRWTTIGSFRSCARFVLAKARRRRDDRDFIARGARPVRRPPMSSSAKRSSAASSSRRAPRRSTRSTRPAPP
jgi:hypothetical protein